MGKDTVLFLLFFTPDTRGDTPLARNVPSWEVGRLFLMTPGGESRYFIGGLVEIIDMNAGVLPYSVENNHVFEFVYM